MEMLNKGLQFIPLENSFSQFTVQKHVDVFFRRLRLQAHCLNQTSIKPTMQDPFLQIHLEHYKWTPNSGQYKLLDKMIEQTHRELEPYFVPKQFNFQTF